MEIIFKGRQTDVPARFREYATAKLNKLEKLDQKAMRVDVEISVERNPRQASQKERVELTIRSRGPAIRAEAAAEDRLAALDLALAKLDSRLRRALDRRKNHHGPGGGAVTGAGAAPQGSAGQAGQGPGGRAPRGVSVPRARSAGQDEELAWEEPAGEEAARAAAGGAGGQAARTDSGSASDRASDGAAPSESVVPIHMEGDGPLVVRQKFHHGKPISIDQALLEMELVGHDFYLFHDAEEDMPSVVYRRHGYQYGVIRLVEHAAEPPGAEASGVGARIPGRRRPEQAPAAGADGAARAGTRTAMRPG